MDTLFPVRLLSQLRPLLIGFRKSKGLTQRELSARLGVTQQTYARLEANPSKASDPFPVNSECYNSCHFDYTSPRPVDVDTIREKKVVL
ncbi:helix-turn-helix domain-containing protein [Klebsiella pneumoniae]|uniref:helix-turn-helix domain-containing protein n=1 Tax=Klebsiella pneumoniae TaxID=573 RepID=UPI00035EBA02|nr:helix-turn-helix transcriptional regulator [Klebsiella pneumoniae]